MDTNDNPLWVERYRPTKIADIVMPEDLKKTFQEFIDQRSVPNLILAGKSGVGKTTVARAVLEELGCDYIVINGSLEGRNIDTLRTTILNYASSMSLMNTGRKYVILDEADYLNSASTQPALRNFMETYSKNCGFILTCNFKNKIIEPLHSRCSTIDFTISNKDKPKIAAEFFKRTVQILKNENIEFDKAVVAQLITKFFPDWRRVLNELQRYSVSGRIDTGILSNLQETSIKTLLKLLKDNNFTEMRRWVAEHEDMDSVEIFRSIYDMSSEFFTKETVPILILILAKYQYQDSFALDKQINTAACLTEIMSGCQFI